MKKVTGLFTKYEFSDDELQGAMILPALNRAFIQTEMATKAEEKATLKPNKPEDNVAVMCEMHYATGYIEALQWILSASDNAKQDLQTRLEEEMQAKALNPKQE